MILPVSFSKIEEEDGRWEAEDGSRKSEDGGMKLKEAYWIQLS